MVPPVLLNNVDHADIRILTGHGAMFGDAINQVTVFPTEYEAVQREYPILLRSDVEGGGYRSVALLGLDRDENLFLNERGWHGRYVPALLQRGPFSIGLPSRAPDGTPQGEPMIHIDLDHPRISRGQEGQPIFLPHGGNSPYLQHVVGVLRAIYVGNEVSAALFAALAELDLIQPIDIEIQLDSGRKYNIPDCHTISQERLMQLDGSALEKLHQNDFLRPAIWIASSLQNVGRLTDIKNAGEPAV